MILGSPLTKGMLWGVLILGAIAATEGGFIVSQAKSIGGLEAKNATQQHALDESGLDLEVCTVSKTALSEEHRKCMDEIRTWKNDAQVAKDKAANLNELLAQETASVHREREIIYKQPGCAELAALDLATACPGLADSLRKRAAEVSAPRSH
jgi:hypothetical protein